MILPKQNRTASLLTQWNHFECNNKAQYVYSIFPTFTLFHPVVQYTHMWWGKCNCRKPFIINSWAKSSELMVWQKAAIVLTLKKFIHHSIWCMRSCDHHASIRCQIYDNPVTTILYSVLLHCSIQTWLVTDFPYLWLFLPAKGSSPLWRNTGWRNAIVAFSVPISVRNNLGHPGTIGV